MEKQDRGELRAVMRRMEDGTYTGRIFGRVQSGKSG